MPSSLPRIPAHGQIALLLILLVIAASAVVTLAGPGAAHHTLISPGCPGCLLHQPGFGHSTLA